MEFNHAETAVLACVHTAMPQGFAIPAINHKGLPDFEVPPSEARQACNHLRKTGFVVKNGAYAQLTAKGMDLFDGLEAFIAKKI